MVLLLLLLRRRLDTQGCCVAHDGELVRFLSLARFLSPSGQFGGLRGGGGEFAGWVNGQPGLLSARWGDLGRLEEVAVDGGKKREGRECKKGRIPRKFLGF